MMTTGDVMGQRGADGPLSESEVLVRVTETNPIKAKVELNKLFNSLSDDECRDLKYDRDIGIGVTAAWEETRRSIVRNAVSPQLTAMLLQRFLGFVEGRIHSPLPEMWESGVLGSKVNRQLDVYFLPRDDKMYTSTEVGVRIRRGATIAQRQERVTLTVEGSEHVIPRAIGPKFDGDALTPHNGVARWYLAVHSEFVPLPYELYCISHDDGKVLWSTKVWGACDGLYVGSGFFHILSIIERESNVVVFGIANKVLYIEAFSISDGKTTFRFTTAY
jgi:hypothetical protein